MMERQRLGPHDPHVLPQPLFVTVQFGTRRARPIGHHRKQRALHGEVQLPVRHMARDHVGNPEPTPERLEDIEIAIRPRIHHAPGRLLRHDLLRGTPPQDTARQPLEPFRHVGVIGASTIIDNTDFRALLLGVPDAFDESHAGTCTEGYIIIFDRSSLFLISMYLGISEDVSRAKTNNSLKFHRAAPRLSAQMYLVLSKSGTSVPGTIHDLEG